MGRTLALCSGTLRTCPGCPHHSRDSGMGRTLALCSGTLGTCPGYPQRLVLDVPSIPGTLGWEGQLDWDAWDMSGMSPAFLGLWDGKDSWIGTLGTCLGCPQHSWDSRMGRLGTLQWDTWDMSGTSPAFPGLWDRNIRHSAVGLYRIYRTVIKFHETWDI